MSGCRMRGCVMVEACGHLPHVEQAALVARHVRDFLEGVAS